jgi:hypothetical protein
MTPWILGVAAVTAALLGAACGGNTPTTATAVTGQTLDWSTSVVPGGATSRTITALQAGTVTVTLAVTGPPIGVGIGIPASGSCRLTLSEVAPQGAVLSAPVEEGDYCVSIFDPGTLTTPLGVRVEIDTP